MPPVVPFDSASFFQGDGQQTFRTGKTASSCLSYHSQLNSIAHKLEIIKLSDNLGSVSSPKLLFAYGKQHEMLEEINQWMKKALDSSYAES